MSLAVAAGMDRELEVSADSFPSHEDHRLQVPESARFFKRNSCHEFKDMRKWQRRRASSFADYFDGDFGQSLLSRNNFRRKSSVSSVSLDFTHLGDTEEDISETIKQANVSYSKTASNQAYFQILPSNWFFLKVDSQTAGGEESKCGRMIVVTGEGQQLTLSQLVASNFTAASGVRELNMTAPTSM